MSFQIRRYCPGDDSQLWALFFGAVRTVNVRDYTPEQVRAWAPDDFDSALWRRRLETNNPFVCLHDEQAVGFADLQPTGYIDHFFVHQDWQRQGVGAVLMNAIERAAQQLRLPNLSSHVSITARPFFESRGFVVQAEQQVSVRGSVLTNYVMIKRLTSG
jgi:putative acetyltransferase